jgi:hypothetical protein
MFGCSACAKYESRKGCHHMFCKKNFWSMPCDTAIHKIVEKFQMTDSMLDKIKYKDMCFCLMRNGLH